MQRLFEWIRNILLQIDAHKIAEENDSKSYKSNFKHGTDAKLNVPGGGGALPFSSGVQTFKSKYPISKKCLWTCVPVIWIKVTFKISLHLCVVKII